MMKKDQTYRNKLCLRKREYKECEDDCEDDDENDDGNTNIIVIVINIVMILITMKRAIIV